ncbi:MAG TPA: DUF885 domain-containing protein [Bryobacteraceae bacterium]|nr:DUF885 domain-containing protein [Bryobacteraceae bacterium]
MRLFVLLAGLVAVLYAGNVPDWVQKSNRNAELLIHVIAKYSPESAGESGVPGLDDQITVLTADQPAHVRQDVAEARKQLEARLGSEKDPLVRQDLEILIAAANRMLRDSEATERHLLPYADVAGTVFYGMQTLLADQVAPARRPAAVIRLRKYTGLEPGYEPMIAMAEQRFREKLQTPGLLGPSRAEVEKNLENTSAYVNGIGLLLEKYKVQGYQDAFARLKEQLAAYDSFVRKDVLPKTRSDFRLPAELYTIQLENFGIDYTPEELTRLAHQSFTDLQSQMQTLASRIASERHLPSADYRDVIRQLKKDQIPGDQILPHYEKRLAEIEAILRREHLITLPDRPAIIRLASAAETAQQPAPHMQPPPLINNHGERGQFVLPLETTGQGGKTLKYDDFSFAAASWTLTAHEARPGHELQFDAMVERGVSLARAMFAFNSTNVEGWGLYSEWFMQPYMPDDAKLVSMDYRLLRAARAFLDPELQEGKVTPGQAMHILENDVVCSPAFATEEVERFTFRMPGQAPSYFDGFTRLLAIRKAAEQALGPKFNVERFHDFILSEGLLPPDLLRKAVMDDFVAPQLAAR